MLKIAQPEFDVLRAHGERAYPYECCGVLLGTMQDDERRVLKVVAWRLTGSVGLLSDAMESVVNLAGAVLALAMLTVMSTAKIYATLKTIRAWHNPWTVWIYLAFALATGAAVVELLPAALGASCLPQALRPARARVIRVLRASRPL